MFHPPLFNVSHYSFLKSALTLQDIVEFAYKHKHKYAVITEINNAYSWIDFRRRARELNLIPVFGLQINHNLSSLLLIAKNKVGYLNLLKIISKNGVSEELLEGIILVHLEGEECFLDHEDRYVANGDQPNGVLVRENKFLNGEDFEFYCLLRSIENNTLVSSEISLNQQCTDDYMYFKTNIGPNSHLVKNIYKILESCEEYEIFEDAGKLNFFGNPEERLRELSGAGMERLSFSSEEERKKYEDRLEGEMKVIADKKFCEYFLVVHEAVGWAKENGICIGPGRGSVCGSLLAYVLGITEIDPIKYGLYFERFLNPDRSQMPDIDIDVASSKRDLLVHHLRDKYGPDHVALISTFQTFKAKNSFREIFRAYGINTEEIDYCSRIISNNPNIDFSNVEAMPAPLKNLMLGFPNTHRAICKILNYPKNPSIHAAGIVISSEPLTGFLPLNGGEVNVSQWNSGDLKEFGIVKFDFLALNYLSALSRIQERVEAHLGRKIVWSEVDENDPEVYKTLREGKNSFIFQFEGSRIRNLIQKFEPSSILDLALLSAIHRPGASDQIPVLLARRSSTVQSKTKNIFFEILKDTYELLVYQEQLMKMIVFVTGCSFGEADTFRRDLIKKEAECREIFFRGGKNKFSESDLEAAWSHISKFAEYGFNKSHAIAYATISYRLLWLKTYHPEFFYEDLLEFSTDEEYLAEIQEAGFDFEPPTYGISKFDSFCVEDGKYFFPVNRIFGISSEFRENFGKIKFQSGDTLEALREFIGAGISEEELLLLIRVGYFNRLFRDGETEAFWEANLSSVVASVLYVDKNNNPIFDLNLNPVETTKETKKIYREHRANLLGLDLNKNRIKPSLFRNHPNILPITKLSEQKSMESRKYLGFLTFAKESKTFRNVPFLSIKLSDSFFTTPTIYYFEENLEEIKEAAEGKQAVMVTVERKDSFLKATKIKIFKRLD